MCANSSSDSLTCAEIAEGSCAWTSRTQDVGNSGRRVRKMLTTRARAKANLYMGLATVVVFWGHIASDRWHGKVAERGVDDTQNEYFEPYAIIRRQQLQHVQYSIDAVRWRDEKTIEGTKQKMVWNTFDANSEITMHSMCGALQVDQHITLSRKLHSAQNACYR